MNEAESLPLSSSSSSPPPSNHALSRSKTYDRIINNRYVPKRRPCRFHCQCRRRKSSSSRSHSMYNQIVSASTILLIAILIILLLILGNLQIYHRSSLLSVVMTVTKSNHTVTTTPPSPTIPSHHKPNNNHPPLPLSNSQSHADTSRTFILMDDDDDNDDDVETNMNPESVGDELLSIITTSNNGTNNSNTTTTLPLPLYTKTNNHVFTNLVHKNNNNDNIPQGIVWLVSFPNSGTTYTISIVQEMTHTSTATNYGGNERDTKNNSVSVFYRDSENNNHTTGSGPYYRSPEQLNQYPYRNANIITKTHCEQHINGTLSKFIASCATGSKYDNYTSIPTTYHSSYSDDNDSHISFPQHVSGIVYLVRNPYTNILGRMNYQRNQWLRSSDPIDHQRAAFFPKNNRTGLYWWCQYKDRKKSVAHTQLLEYQNGTFYEQYLQPVPCYMEFYLYFRWHNMVNEMISHFQNSTVTSDSHAVMTIYYEDYDRYDSRTTIVEPLLYDMLHFTPDQIINATIPPFIVENYNSNSSGNLTHNSDTDNTSHHIHSKDTNLIDRMFTQPQQMAIQRLAQEMTTPQTWSILQHYFVKTTHEFKKYR